MEWTEIDESQELPFVNLIRRTVLHSLASSEYPFIRLKGIDSEQDFDLTEETVDRYGWAMHFSSPIVYFGHDEKSTRYHWHFVGRAVSDELREVFKSAGLENTFMAYWDSKHVTSCLDHNGFVYEYNRPAVDVLNSPVSLDYFFKEEPPDWEKFKQGIEDYSTLIALRAED